MPTSLISESLIEPLPAFVATQGLDNFQASTRFGRVLDRHGEPHVAVDKVLQTFENLSGELKNPSFGLDYARGFPAGGTGAYGFILLQSDTLRTDPLPGTRVF